MLRFLLTTVLLACLAGLSAQAPSGFRFQAVARDAMNDVMATDNIAVRVSLLAGGPSGAVRYSERHEVTTTDLGIFDLHIGNGTGLSGDINTLEWGTDSYFLKIDIDPEGGDSYINLGSSQLLSVPYALYAKESGSGGGGGDPTDELQNLIYDPATQVLTLTDGNSVTLQVGGGGGMPQTLTFDNTTRELMISGGNTITIPGGATGPQGPQGAIGPTGPAGADGADGADGTPGPQGPTGDQGPSGPEGPAGQDGTGISLQGTVTTVGNLPAAGNSEGDLYIVSASGDGYAWDGSMWNNVGPIQGPEGPQGIAGPEGPAGPAGANGMAGTDGPAGPIGPQGDPGPQGLQGIAGPAGPAGANGTDGTDGADGAAGSTGPQGDPGPQGPAGPAGPAGDLELEYYDEAAVENGATFHIHNTTTNASYGVVGSTGSSTIPANRAGVLGYSTNAHGVYGVSDNSFFAGVQGVSGSAEGIGVQGYGFGGGVGGHFYTTTTGVAALTTGRGNVGIGIDEPEMKMHVGGDLFVQTNLGELVMGFPDNGNQWQFSTRGQGADLQFQSKADGLTSFTTRFRMRQGGEFQIGDIGNPTAWMEISKNSTVSKPQLKLEEVGNDFARLELSNTTSGDSYWQVAGMPSTNTSSGILNFYHHNGTAGFNRMTVTGDGRIGINGPPTGGRLHINQGGQASNSGLRFSDGTANQDWDVRHGFGLSFIYGGTLRATISATTGAYIQGSDSRLKKNIAPVGSVMKRLNKLEVSSYQYKSDTTNTTTFGLIAQDVLPLFPELVEYMPADKLYGVNYSGFSMVAIKAIQEQQVTIEAQQTKIGELEARLARLEALLLKD